MEFLDHGPLEGKKFQFVGRVVGFNLCQTPASIGNNGIHTVIMCLVEDSPQAIPASIGVELKRPHEISIGNNGCCGAQALQVIKGALAPVIPHDNHLPLVHIFTRCQFMQGSSYLHELGNEPPVNPRKHQTSVTVVGVGHLLIAPITLIAGYFLGRDDMLQVGNYPVEWLTFGRFKF